MWNKHTHPPPLKINNMGTVIHFMYRCKLVSVSDKYQSENRDSDTKEADEMNIIDNYSDVG